MKALIVEDERIAQLALRKLLEEIFIDMEIVGTTRTVKETVEFLQSGEITPPDLIFMDVELLDGNCFDIFRKVHITSNVILTTAYNKYAVEAFKVGCIDYLLKPINPQALCRSVERCRKNLNFVDSKMILTAFKQFTANKPTDSMEEGIKHRFLIRAGENFVLVLTKDIAYLYSEDNTTFIVTKRGDRYMINLSLDVIYTQLDHYEFFRISRVAIISLSEIREVMKIKGGRLKIATDFEPKCDMTVSRSRVEAFLAWLA